MSGGSYGNSYDVGGGDFRGIDQIMRMYNDPDKGSKYPDSMLKNIEQILLDLYFRIIYKSKLRKCEWMLPNKPLIKIYSIIFSEWF